MQSLQLQIEKKGREIFRLMRDETASVFSFSGLQGILMDWAMRDEAFKVRLFRFVDVLPALRASPDVCRCVQEYLGVGDSIIARAVRAGRPVTALLPWPVAFVARRVVEGMARRFIVGRDVREAVAHLKEIRNSGMLFTVDILGEAVVSEVEAEKYLGLYMELLEHLSVEAKSWPGNELLDRGRYGSVPLVNVSVKLSSFSSHIVPAARQESVGKLKERLRPLLFRAKEVGAFINFDMESYVLKDLTLAVFKALLEEEAFRDWPHAGIVLQAYLKDAARDVEDLIRWAQTRSAPITVRLVKGAYWDYETILARQKGWDPPVLEKKDQTDRQFEELAKRLLENERWIRPCFGTHNVRSIAACMALAEKMSVPKEGYEIQMIYGMAEPIKKAVVKMGGRVREYCPVGAMLPGMAYLVRRLLENTSNEGFLRATFKEHLSVSDLLGDPGSKSGCRKPDVKPFREEGFQNQPLLDLSQLHEQDAVRAALIRVRREKGRFYPLVIGRERLKGRDVLTSVNPACPSEEIGKVAIAGSEEGDKAVMAARRVFPAWSGTSPSYRADLLNVIAGRLTELRHEFMAWEILEAGKTWEEADADVTEAVDFCRFYAAEMLRLGMPRRTLSVLGEESFQEYIPRGVALVIAPWNFPLAILCGMTVAALVAGNCVLIKPAEQTSVIAARFMEVLLECGLPPGVANFVPGRGEEVGASLVEHPGVDLIVFTGSREVGVSIWEKAGRTSKGQAHLKKVICEMGGKNAIIVDDDADLDEAVVGCVHSAFGFQGQKCSALSRLIVMEAPYERLLRRLTEATLDLKMGLPEDPATRVGPVIDAAAQEKIRSYICAGKGEATVVCEGAVPAGLSGYFVPPVIFQAPKPEAGILRNEIFGPVLTVMRSKRLSQAIDLVNDCEYALTGGIYSRSPQHIEICKRRVMVGNFYINRPITGAVVGRHPFGGFKMSGGGTKAGGADYLTHFMLPRVTTENSMRRGFAPEV